MAKINDTTTYPNTTPALTDHVPGTDVSNTANDAAGETVTFTLQGVMDLFEANFAAPASAISSGTFADARIAASNVTQHEAALTITESQISDLGTYAVAATLASTSNGEGAALIGIEDSGGNFTATDVEGALAELAGASGGFTQEQIEDFVGGMVTGNTETGITVTYQDGDGTLDFVVADLTVAGDTGSTGMTPGDTLTIAGGTNVTTAMSGDTLTINASGSGGDVDGGSASSAGDAIQWRRDTAANWTSNDPTLAAGEAGYETDTGFIKVGDGSTAWTSLGYTLSGLADPGADRGTGWDDSAGAMAFWTAGTGLSFDGSFNLNVGGLTVSEIAAGSLTGSDADLVTGTAGTSGNLVQWDANGDAVDSSIAASDVAVQAVTENAQTGTTYTLVLGDASKLVSMSNASANTLTIPTNASVAFPVGTTIVVVMKGAGTTTIAGATGVTVNGVSAGSGDLSAQWGAVSLYKSATDTWYAMGSIGTVA